MINVINQLNVTERGLKCPINYRDGYAIHYLSEEDAYKIYMFIPQLERHANDIGTYIFDNRSYKTAKFTKEMFEEIKRQFEHLSTLRWTDVEIDYLKSIRHLRKHKGALELLRFLYLDLRYLRRFELDEDGKLHIEAEGPIYIVSQFEIYTLSIVSYVWNLFNDTYDNIYNEGIKRWATKAAGFEKGGKYERIKGKIAEFGTRRRNLPELQDLIVSDGCSRGIFSGTSNLYLAMKYGVTPIGTHAHEYFMMFQGIANIPVAYTIEAALNEWLEIFGGDLGIALTDTLTTRLHWRAFKRLYMCQFTGIRTDSGDDHQHIDDAVKAYEAEGVDPKTKKFLVSNSYDFDKFLEIYDYVDGRMDCQAGIGTFITNDSTVPPLNIVMKLQYVNGKPVAKISDDGGKTLCQDPSYTVHLKDAINWRLEHEEE